jgi:hypothetical protein
VTPDSHLVGQFGIADVVVFFRQIIAGISG